jgi:hypothetical protein
MIHCCGVNFRELGHDLRTRNFYAPDIRRFRAVSESAVAQVRVAPRWARDAEPVDRADGGGQVRWTEPLTASQIDDLTLIVFNATLFVTSLITGMRSSEVMELSSESVQPPEDAMEGLVRYRLASMLIKGQQWGGVRDEWVVIEPAYRAVELAIRLTRAKTYLAARQARGSFLAATTGPGGSIRSDGGSTARPEPGSGWNPSPMETSPAG